MLGLCLVSLALLDRGSNIPEVAGVHADIGILEGILSKCALFLSGKFCNLDPSSLPSDGDRLGLLLEEVNDSALAGYKELDSRVYLHEMKGISWSFLNQCSVI